MSRFLSALALASPDICVVAMNAVSRAVQTFSYTGLHGHVMRVMALDNALKFRKDANVYVKVCQGRCFSQHNAIAFYWRILCVGELGGQILLQYSPCLHLQTEGCTISNSGQRMPLFHDRLVKAERPARLANKTFVVLFFLPTGSPPIDRQ